jgi:hypothetical protein
VRPEQVRVLLQAPQQVLLAVLQVAAPERSSGKRVDSVSLPSTFYLQCWRLSGKSEH